jgi:hypothetical protein
MKTLACIVVAGCALAGPVIGFAQSTAPVTRAQVHEELIRLDQAGYRLGDRDHTKYPEQIQAAEAKITAQDSQQAGNTEVGGTPTAGSTDVGGTPTNGTSASGSAQVQHMSTSSPSSCVGPASYCSLFFGN